MFFDNIFGTSGNNNSNNNRSSNDNENENDNMYSLKNISLSQGRAFLKDEKKLNRMNTYLAQNAGNNNIVGMSIEGFTTGLDMSQQPQAAVASAAASSAPEAVLPTDEATTPLDKLDDAFDSKMAAYSSALSEYNKELLKNQNYFVVPVISLTPINSCFSCDASLSGTDCAAMGVSNSNGDIRTALPSSLTETLRPCVQAGVTVPGWSAHPTDSGSCVASLEQKCCPKSTSMVNGTPMCVARFNDYHESGVNKWISKCISPLSPEEVNQKIALANEYCQGNGISLNYWSTNANNFVLVTTQDPGNIRPFAKMNSIPVWIVNTFPNLQDANKEKTTLVFSPKVEKTLASTREDMLNAGTALIKAASSQHSVTSADRKAIEQKINAIKAKISKLDSHKSTLDGANGKNGGGANANVNALLSTNHAGPPMKESFLSSSLSGQEEDTRIQFKASYAYYTVWFVIAILLIAVLFSNIFMVNKTESEDGEEGGSSTSSFMLIMGTLIAIVFVYFIIQYILSYFKISRPSLPFNDVNPLF
jgi:hypothetical protein